LPKDKAEVAVEKNPSKTGFDIPVLKPPFSALDVTPRNSNSLFTLSAVLSIGREASRAAHTYFARRS
jgi:hypothetical protein